MREPSQGRDLRRRMVRARNDARVASHTAWVLRMDALEARLRTIDLAKQNLALVEGMRVDDRL